MEEKYVVIISRINDAIKEFEGYLASVIKISGIGTDNKSAYLNLDEFDWSTMDFPKGGHRGVYFMLGTNIHNKNEVAVYVGKSSFNSCIKNRLEAHLKNRGFDNRIYQFKEHIIEHVFVVALDDNNDDLAFLASSMEEFIIDELRIQKVSLLNAIGNY